MDPCGARRQLRVARPGDRRAGAVVASGSRRRPDGRAVPDRVLRGVDGAPRLQHGWTAGPDDPPSCESVRHVQHVLPPRAPPLSGGADVQAADPGETPRRRGAGHRGEESVLNVDTKLNADAVLRTQSWRCIGPFRGGRVVAVAGDPTDPAVFYFGACAGGVWKTSDAGTYWENVSDGFFKTAAVGAVAVAEADPNVVYAGMGESTIRGDVSHGDGGYRSTDAGRTWTHCGLTDTRHIGKVRVHPRDPDVVYVAALGHAFGPNSERGVYRSRNGGRNWERVHFVSDRAGAVDLSIARANPRIL